MLGIPGSLELWLQTIDSSRTVLAEQPRQSFSEQKIELSAQRSKPFREGAILKLRWIDVDTPANPAGFRPRSHHTEQLTHEVMQRCPLRTVEQ